MAKISLYYPLPICAGDSLFYQAELTLFDKIPFKRSRLGGARLFCQALFDSFWGSKKNEEIIKTVSYSIFNHKKCK